VGHEVDLVIGFDYGGERPCGSSPLRVSHTRQSCFYMATDNDRGPGLGPRCHERACSVPTRVAVWVGLH
jgi:hypothetical protein